MIKASKFAIAIAAVASLAIATVEESSAAPVTVGANTVIAPAASEVVYRGYPYTYGPAYTYRGYTYWYPSYGNWVYPGDYYYYNWW